MIPSFLIDPLIDQIIQAISGAISDRPGLARFRDPVVEALKADGFKDLTQRAFQTFSKNSEDDLPEFFDEGFIKMPLVQQKLTMYIVNGDDADMNALTDLYVKRLSKSSTASDVNELLERYLKQLRQTFVTDPDYGPVLTLNSIDNMHSDIKEMKAMLEHLVQKHEQETKVDNTPLPVIDPEPPEHIKKRSQSGSRLFISYKRGTDGIYRLMNDLKKANYSVWFDRDDIKLGDSDWQEKIQQGIWECAGLILCLTPKAVISNPIRFEVATALAWGKPIFPIMLEELEDIASGLTQVGLPDHYHVGDLTSIDNWNEHFQQLLNGLKDKGITVTSHDLRQRKDRNNYDLHQTYLRRLAERIGTINLAQIRKDETGMVNLEDVYIDSPTALSLSVEVKNWRVVDWGISTGQNRGNRGEIAENPFVSPESLGYERAPLETLIQTIEQRIDDYRLENPDKKPDEQFSWRNEWNNGIKENVLALHLQDIASAVRRLVVLGDPGSGKSTFVRHLALCLCGAGITDWHRKSDLSQLRSWTHDALTPVYIELRRFIVSKHFPEGTNTIVTADHLWAYIRDEVLGNDLVNYAEDLEFDLKHGYAVIILDGLDEVPFEEGKLRERQNQLSDLTKSLNTRYTGSRIIVASRPYAYEGWRLPGFEDIKITTFEDRHRIDLATNLYKRAMEMEVAQQKAQALNQQLQPVHPELKDRPLFVTLMATIFLKGDREGLPTRRGALYRESILLLLERWTQSKPDAPSLLEILGDRSIMELYDRLAKLAYTVHSQYGEAPGTPEISEGLIYEHLKPLVGKKVVHLIPYLSENAGVLVSPGQNQDDEKDVFHFAHRTFQEYLSAEQLAKLCEKADSFELIGALITEKPQLWRMPCTLFGDVLADTNRRSDLWYLLDDLLPDDVPEGISATDPIWWRVWLASMILEEQNMVDGSRLRSPERAVCDQLRDWTHRLVLTPEALKPVERAVCGRALSKVKDTRPGVVMVSNGVPDIAWSDVIPADTYRIGQDDGAYDDEKPEHDVHLGAYQVSLYPVTNAQYRAFVDAKGYDNKHYWTEAGWTQKEKDSWTQPEYWLSERFGDANQPVVGVSWYEAIAFCNWISEETGQEIRLPTEAEWEVAARGKARSQYPYGDEFDANKANVNDTGIGRTSAVGMFPDGASWCGALDMSGNVWEWCATKWRGSYEVAEDNELEGDDSRVLRGGSFVNLEDFSRAALRSRLNPYYRFSNFGFRLCLVFCPPSE